MSQATSALEQLGFVRRMSRRGERGDFFRIRPGVWDEMMRRDLEANRVFLRMAERGLDLLGSRDPESRRNLEEMLEFYRYREEKLSAALEGWQEARRMRDA